MLFLTVAIMLMHLKADDEKTLSGCNRGTRTDSALIMFCETITEPVDLGGNTHDVVCVGKDELIILQCEFVSKC